MIPTVALLTAVLTAASGIVGADTANVAGFPSLFATMTLAPCDVGDDSDEALVDESGAADEAPFEDSEDAAEK